MFGFVHTPDQEQASDPEIARVCGIHTIAMSFECRPRGVERPGGPTQLARDERNLGLGHNASGARHCLLWTKAARRFSQECLCANEIAELGHGNAAQRERRRVVAQGNAL
jgi:hypothetical protein